MMFEYFKIVVFDKYAEFEGRARRAENWYFFLAHLLFSFILGVVLGLIGISGNSADNVILVMQLILLLPSFAVGIRRMHDIDKSGWFILIPLYNIYLAAQPGTVGPNRFGVDPKGGVTADEVPVPMPVPVPPPPPTT